MSIGRWKNLQELQSLNPRIDNQRIVYLMAGHEFSWDMVRSLEIALLRTFGSPSISRLLQRTKEFHRHGQKRYDDTSLMIAEFLKHGYDSELGQRAISHINDIHSFYDISNRDYLYVLSTFVTVPIDWIDDYGWRSLCDAEREGLFHFFYEVGRRMGLTDIPESLSALRAFAAEYEANHFVFDEANQDLVKTTMRVMEEWLPKPLRFLVFHATNAMIDDAMRQAFGFPPVPRWWRWVVRRSLKLRGWLVRWLPTRRKAGFIVDGKSRTYPDGYGNVEDLGPAKIVKHLKGGVTGKHTPPAFEMPIVASTSAAKAEEESAKKDPAFT